MKYDLMMRVYGTVYGMLYKLPEKGAKKKIMKEYRRIVEGAKPILPGSIQQGSYALGAYFIAMNRMDGLTGPENSRLLEAGIRSNPMVKTVMGDAKSYFAPKRMEVRQKWAEQSRRREYENEWVADVLGKNGKYEMGYDYHECGIVKLCRDEGCPELAKELCRLDFALVDAMGIGLDRTTTLAEGGEKCDFRFYKKEG